MLALLFVTLALPAVLLAFILGYRRGARNGRRKLMELMRRMIEDDDFAAEVTAAGRVVLAGRAAKTPPAAE